MSFTSALFGKRETKLVDATALLWESLSGGPSSKAGVSVNINSALRVSTVLACCRVIAEDVAKLPLKLYREDDKGRKTVAEAHPVHRLLLWPNEWQTSFEFRETLTLHALLAKGGFAVISRASNGNVLELLPVVPGNVTIRRSKAWDVLYEIRDAQGTVVAVLPRTSVLHVRGPSWDGVTGMEIVSQARDAIGLAIAAEESQGRLYANGARPSGILSADGELKKETVERLRGQIEQVHKGVENMGKLLILDRGFKFSPTAMTGVDAQTLESRKHQVEEICRMFRVYPSKIGYSDKAATYASAEQFNIAHVVDTLMPWVSRWEGAIARDLLTDAAVAQGYYARFSVQGLLRGDQAARGEFYASGITNGWMTRNEARRLEELDPIDGLDEPLVPLNMGTEADRAAALAKQAAAQDAAAKTRAAELEAGGAVASA